MDYAESGFIEGHASGRIQIDEVMYCYPSTGSCETAQQTWSPVIQMHPEMFLMLRVSG